MQCFILELKPQIYGWQTSQTVFLLPSERLSHCHRVLSWMLQLIMKDCFLFHWTNERTAILRLFLLNQQSCFCSYPTRPWLGLGFLMPWLVVALRAGTAKVLVVKSLTHIFPAAGRGTRNIYLVSESLLSQEDETQNFKKVAVQKNEPASNSALFHWHYYNLGTFRSAFYFIFYVSCATVGEENVCKYTKCIFSSSNPVFSPCLTQFTKLAECWLWSESRSNMTELEAEAEAKQQKPQIRQAGKRWDFRLWRVRRSHYFQNASVSKYTLSSAHRTDQTRNALRHTFVARQ